MACFYRRLAFKKILCCCDTSPETVCCIVGSVCIFVAFNHLCNFIPFFCLLTAIPHCLIMLLMALAGSLLIAGISFRKPFLVILFPWIMVACILLQIAYGVIVYVSERCISSVLALLFGGSTADSGFTGIMFGYTLIGAIGGIDFIFSLYALLLVSCCVTEIVFDPRRRATASRSAAKSDTHPRACNRAMCYEEYDMKCSAGDRHC